MADSLMELSADLRKAARRAPEVAHDVVKRGAVQIKRDWRANAKESAGQHGRLYPYSIGFDITPSGADYVEAEIGPDKELPQGALGNLIEWGSVNNPPHNDGGRALRTEEPRFIKAMEDAVRDLVP